MPGKRMIDLVEIMEKLKKIVQVFWFRVCWFFFCFLLVRLIEITVNAMFFFSSSCY